MHDEMEKIEEIEPIKMYKMIQALHQYDYYSTKCLVSELLQKRSNENEKRNLSKIKELLFEQKNSEIETLLDKYVHYEMNCKKEKRRH